MDDLEKKLSEIFLPNYLTKIKRIQEEGIRFVHYTNADAAMKIIKNREVWLRNTQCMNDYMEVEHGLDCLVNAFKSETEGKRFKEMLNNLFPGIVDELTKTFDAWIPVFRSSTFIMCVSEHTDSEDQFGKLSMWRAYGGRNSVAVVVNNKAFFSETDVFKAYTCPVEYIDSNGYGKQMDDLRMRMEKENKYLLSIGKDAVLSWLFYTFKYIVLCTKHPGFAEEKEWRLVYTPKDIKSEYVKGEIETINNVPQVVHKIPLKDIPEQNFTFPSISELIDRIIIGPNDQQYVIGDAFKTLLKSCNCQDVEKKIYYSGIPLR
jgi:hypothetical protein